MCCIHSRVCCICSRDDTNLCNMSSFFFCLPMFVSFCMPSVCPYLSIYVYLFVSVSRCLLPCHCLPVLVCPPISACLLTLFFCICLSVCLCLSVRLSVDISLGLFIYLFCVLRCILLTYAHVFECMLYLCPCVYENRTRVSFSIHSSEPL